jgi:hypothetical protein
MPKENMASCTGNSDFKKLTKNDVGIYEFYALQ